MPPRRESWRRGRGSTNKQKRCRAKKQKRWGSQSWKRNMVERVDNQRSHMNRPLSDASDQWRWSVTFYSDHMPPLSLLLTFTLASSWGCGLEVSHMSRRIAQTMELISFVGVQYFHRESHSVLLYSCVLSFPIFIFSVFHGGFRQMVWLCLLTGPVCHTQEYSRWDRWGGCEDRVNLGLTATCLGSRCFLRDFEIRVTWGVNNDEHVQNT